MKPKYDLAKIKFATDPPTYHRGVELYEKGKITTFKAHGIGFSATVQGGELYDVHVSSKNYDQGNCSCYLGQQDVLCKHMVAVAIRAVTDGKPLSAEDKETQEFPTCSGKPSVLSAKELSEVKGSITAALRCIKPYNGPSRIWFAYQASLSEGCNRLSAIVSDLSVSPQTAKLMVDLLLRLDKKLSVGGVDDSDGTVGAFMEACVHVLTQFANLDAVCVKEFRALKDIETCFEWEEPLVRLLTNPEL